MTSSYAAAQQQQWRNKAISDTYEPGSTFKIITLAMALEEGVVERELQLLLRRQRERAWAAARRVQAAGRHGGHGSQTLTQAVQHSCNVAFVNIGLLVGEEKFYEYAEAFGFIDRTADTLASSSRPRPA